MPGRSFRALLTLSLGIAVAARLFLCEEEEGGEPGSHVGRVRWSAAVAQSDAAAAVEARAAFLSTRSRRRIRRHRAVVLAAAVLTAGIPIVAAAEGPAWAVAALAAAATVGQLWGQLTDDYRIGVEQHLLAVQLTRELRRFERRSAAATGPQDVRAAEDDLVSRAEDLDERYEDRVAGLLRGGPAAEPPARRA